MIDFNETPVSQPRSIERPMVAFSPATHFSQVSASCCSGHPSQDDLREKERFLRAEIEGDSSRADGDGWLFARYERPFSNKICSHLVENISSGKEFCCHIRELALNSSQNAASAQIFVDLVTSGTTRRSFPTGRSVATTCSSRSRCAPALGDQRMAS